MTRVLVDDFGGLLRVGVDEVLRGEQIEVVHSDGDLLARLLQQPPARSHRSRRLVGWSDSRRLRCAAADRWERGFEC